jgi:hypothetical protein
MVGLVRFPVPTGRVHVTGNGQQMPIFHVAIYRRTAHMLSGGRRIYRFETETP